MKHKFVRKQRDSGIVQRASIQVWLGPGAGVALMGLSQAAIRMLINKMTIQIFLFIKILLQIFEDILWG